MGNVVDSEWGEPVKIPAASRKLASVVSVRFSPAEDAKLRAFVEGEGRSLSGFLREAGLRAANYQGASHTSQKTQVCSTATVGLFSPCILWTSAAVAVDATRLISGPHNPSFVKDLVS